MYVGFDIQDEKNFLIFMPGDVDIAPNIQIQAKFRI